MNSFLFTAICFFISGFTALSYELTWTRLLKHIFGSSSFAISTILTVFIGGLALGSFLAGKYIDQIRNFKKDLLVSYAFIELAVGIYALFVPFLFSDFFIAPIWSIFLQGAGEGLIISSIFRFIFSAILLLVPTVLMGMTFPVLSQYLVSKKESTDKIAYLYAINTSGAILGCLVSGFVLLPLVGLNKTIILGSILNFGIFLAVLIFKDKFKEESLNEKLSSSLSSLFDSDHKQKKLETLAKNTLKDLSEKSLLSIIFLTGFIALGLEVVWSKALALILGSSVYALTITLSSFLLGISLGAFLLNLNLDKIKSASSFISKALIALAAFILIASLSFNELPWIFLSLTKFLPDATSFTWWPLLNLIRFLVAGSLMMPVALITGAIFTLVLNIFSANKEKTDSKHVASDVAKVYYLNTLGSIFGSFSIGFIFIPFFNGFSSGMQSSNKLMIAIAVLVALSVYFESKKQSKPGVLKTSLSAVTILIAIIIFIPSWKPGVMSSGVAIYHDLVYKNISRNQYDQIVKAPILFHKEGLNTIVTVSKSTRSNAIFLKNNGKNEAGIPINNRRPSKADMVTQILLGQIPLLIHSDEVKNALVIGLGGGCTLGSTLRSKGLEKVDLCELESAVIEAEKYFEPSAKKHTLSANGSPLNKKRNPLANKVKVHSRDGRNFLLGTKEKYDVIISQPSDPWISGSGDLYTREFWQLSASKLNDDGLFAQWLQLYSITPELLGTVLNTFHSAFSEVSIFRPGEAGELILIGSKSPIKLDLEKINNKINSEFLAKSKRKKLTVRNREDLARISIKTPQDLLANLLIETKGVEKIIEKTAKGKINTDDNMKIEFSVAKNTSFYDQTLAKNMQELADASNPRALAENLIIKDSRELAMLAIKHNQMAQSSDIQDYTNTIHGELALGLAELALEREENPSNYLAFAEIFNSLGKRSETVSFIKKALQSSSKASIKDSKHYSDLAKLHYLNRDLSNAIANANVAIKLDPKNTQAAKDKGLFYYELYKANKLNGANKDNLLSYLNQSEQAYKAAIKADKWNMEAWAGIGNVEFVKAASFGDEHALKHAIKSYKKAIKSNVHFWPSFLNLAKLYSAMDKKYQKKAIRTLEDTITLNPKAMEAHYHLAMIQYEQGSLQGAHSHLRKVVKFCEGKEGNVNNFCSGPGGIKLSQLKKAKTNYEKLNKLINGESLVDDDYEPIVLN